MADTLETTLHSARSPIEQAVAELGPWFHNLHLPDGTQTAPDHRLGDFPFCKWVEIESHLPEDLSGWTALDVGCNAGFYCFEMARRGADVLGIDVDPKYLAQAEWACNQFDTRGTIRFEQMQVYDLARSDRCFDLVLFLGVFYHLRYPLLAMDILARRVRHQMLFQSLTMPGGRLAEGKADHDFEDRESFLHPGWPKMSFIEERFAGDPTNWWIPNHAGVEAMLRSAGLRITTQASHDMYICTPEEPSHRDAQLFIDDQLRAATGATI